MPRGTLLWKVVASVFILGIVLKLLLNHTTLKSTKKVDEKNIDISELKCLEPNICPETIEKGHVIYRYTRLYSFYHNLNQRINYDVNVTNDHDVIPRIVHFIWISTERHSSFKFFQLLSMMAAQRHVKPVRIYFWHNKLPEGGYWEEALRVVKNIYFVRIERLTQIYGNPVLYAVHVSDLVRFEVLMEFGGMYFDFDSIVVNDVTPLLKYDTVLGYEAWYMLANGMMFTKPWSDFFRVWHPRYQTFKNEYALHSNIVPNDIYLRQKNLVHVEEWSICKPNYKMREWLFDDGKLWNWREKNYVLHLYEHAYRDAGFEDLDPENIKYMNTTIGEISRHTYYGDSRLWEYRPLPLRNRTLAITNLTKV